MATVGNESAALVALQKAVQLKKLDKFDKARKLLDHALFLSPSHPDVLNSYGEFLEEVEKNIIEADYFYHKVLAVCPEHCGAVENVKRTKPLVDEMDQGQLSKLSLKQSNLNEVMESRILRRIQEEDYYQQIHHTVAIEGNTLSLLEIETFIKTNVQAHGKSMIEHNEILGVVDALKFVNDVLLQKIGPITEGDLLSIHEKIYRRINATVAGRYRETQVFVGGHVPPPTAQVCNLMEDFFKWLNSDHEKSHPVKLAALAHHKLSYIHPFTDGNGRTARLFMNLILMRAGYPGIIIRKKDSDLYFKYLQIADETDARPFIRFIALNTEEALDVYYNAYQCGISEIQKHLKHNDITSKHLKHNDITSKHLKHNDITSKHLKRNCIAINV